MSSTKLTQVLSTPSNHTPHSSDPHWTKPYLRKPWRPYTSGPRAYDCWGLVVAVLRDVFQHKADRHREVPIGDDGAFEGVVRQEIASGHWQQVPQPQEGAVVLFAQTDLFSHVGIFTAANGGRVLHCRQGCGVLLESPSAILAQGIQALEYWIPV